MPNANPAEGRDPASAVCGTCGGSGIVWHAGIPGITNPRPMSCGCRVVPMQVTTTNNGGAIPVFTVPTAPAPATGETPEPSRDATQRFTHAELCAGLGIPPSVPRPDWLPYAVQATRVEIFVEDERRHVYGGAMHCGVCGFGVDFRPGLGMIGPNGPTTAADLLACPRCGATQPDAGSVVLAVDPSRSTPDVPSVVSASPPEGAEAGGAEADALKALRDAADVLRRHSCRPLADDLDAITARLTAQASALAALRAREAKMRHAGALLANCAFNLAQDTTLTDRARRSLDESRRAWDAAISPTEPTDA